MGALKSEVTAISSGLKTLHANTASKIDRILDVLRKAPTSQQLTVTPQLRDSVDMPPVQNTGHVQELYSGASAGAIMSDTSSSPNTWMRNEGAPAPAQDSQLLEDRMPKHEGQMAGTAPLAAGNMLDGGGAGSNSGWAPVSGFVEEGMLSSNPRAAWEGVDHSR